MLNYIYIVNATFIVAFNTTFYVVLNMNFQMLRIKRKFAV